MSKRVELVFVTKQKTIILPRVESTITKGVFMATRVK
jgi:hypothetical protein